MSDSRRLHLILCWHMHQPDYRDYASGDFTLPWTYLHAIKDYTDMAYHLEQYPEARAVINFVPVLLDQLDAYAQGFREGRVPDPLLRLLVRDNLDSVSQEERELVLRSCFRGNYTTMLEPFPAYRRLLDLHRILEAEDGAIFSYLSGQYLADLLVWFHLAWTGESVRRQHEVVIRLMTKGAGFTLSERQELFRLIGDLAAGVVPRYKALLEQGRVELSTTPYYHPIAPLLIDFDAARDALPSAPLPGAQAYPGGRTRVSYHVGAALESHRARFGRAPQGMWPAEGGVSDAVIDLMAEAGVAWVATGQGVLENTLRRAPPDGPPTDKGQHLYRPYRMPAVAENITCFFRDDRLSDLIGFEYAKWYGRDAVNNFVHELEQILANSPSDEEPVVSVILDGENAWESYPYNGYYFLSGMYEALQGHQHIQMTTFGDYLSSRESSRGKGAHGGLKHARTGVLQTLVAGSWVYGNFSTWIGSPDKNRAWDLLCAAKQHFDKVLASGRLNEEEQAAAYRQLADCESSDWFWWFGDYNPAETVASFDRLFRENLARLYGFLRLPAPEALSRPISRGGEGAEMGGTMRRSSH